MSDPTPSPVSPPEPQFSAPAYSPPPQDAAPAYVQQMPPAEWAPAPLAVRPLRGIGGATRWLILVCSAISFVTILVDLWGIASLDSFQAGSTGIGALTSFDTISRLLSILWIVVYLASATCWVVWQYRAASSLERVALRRGPGWHVGAWFVPIVAWFWPFQNITDITQSSRAALGSGRLRLWWGMWVAGNLATSFASRMLASATTIPSLISALTWEILSDALLIAAAVLAWMVVSRITDAIDPRVR